jgi:hypothetical protein
MSPEPAASEYEGLLQEQNIVELLKLVVHRDSILPSEKTTSCGIRVRDGGIWHIPLFMKMIEENKIFVDATISTEPLGSVLVKKKHSTAQCLCD